MLTPLTPLTPLNRSENASASDLSIYSRGTSCANTTSSSPISSPESIAFPDYKLTEIVSSLSLSRSNSVSRPSSRSLSRRTSLNRRNVINHSRLASYAFAFDIDGVLIRGPDTIPVAPKALRMLNGDNKYNIKVPYIFVTNGGGKTEEKRCSDLSERLGVEVVPEQFIQGHTPMKDLAHNHGTVLIIGGVGEECRLVAERYGFKDIVTPVDILKWNPHVAPFKTLSEEELKNAKDRDFSKINIEAILVFADSRDWATDQQIILELLMSKNGVMGTLSETFEEGPKIYFAHSDFVWATKYGLNRYGMGALQITIGALYKAHTGKELAVNKFGKPHRATFHYASKVLKSWRQETFETNFESSVSPFDSESSEDETAEAELDQSIHNVLPEASTVYFVGDTPESDIRFANSFDKNWYSMLVKTGVYQEGTEPKYKPKVILNNVLEAVEYAIEREHQKELEIHNSIADSGIEFESTSTIHPHILRAIVEKATVVEGAETNTETEASVESTSEFIGGNTLIST